MIINRIDNICHAILKGKWPSSSQQFETQSLLTAPAVASNAGSRNSFAESEAPDPSFSNGVLISQVHVRGALGQGQAWDSGVKRCPEVLRSFPSGTRVFTASWCRLWCVAHGLSHLVLSTEGSWCPAVPSAPASPAPLWGMQLLSGSSAAPEALPDSVLEAPSMFRGKSGHCGAGEGTAHQSPALSHPLLLLAWDCSLAAQQPAEHPGLQRLGGSKCV